MKNFYYLILLLFTCMQAIPQIAVAPPQIEAGKEIPGEKVFVHYNSALLFAGEYIYYKVYVHHSVSGELSFLSEVAYVDLLGEDGNAVFRHKVKLDKGTGQGDFFIPTDVPSGSYKLVGYTQWMLNGGAENIFQSDLAILNPYRGDQRSITANGDMEGQMPDAITSEISPTAQNSSGSGSYLYVSNKKFSPRQKVSLKMSAAIQGDYSVSVRKVENIKIPRMPTSVDHYKLSGNSNRDIKSPVHLPELRGELIRGRIEPFGNNKIAPVQNIKIALSIPGENYVVKVARTNRNGDFFFNVDEHYSGSTAFLEVIEAEDDQYRLIISKKAEPEHKALSFNKFNISPAMEKMIVKRSVYNQIENAYYGVKPDTIIEEEYRKPFYEMQPIVYNLDDYTRFPGIRETFVEIIREAYVRTSNGKPAIRIRSARDGSTLERPPLIIVDGLVVQDHATFLNIPAKEIQQIGVVSHNYYLGPQLFGGILDVRTTASNFQEGYTSQNFTSIELEKPQPPKRYFKQRYDNELHETIPDFRYQLLWEPTVQFTGDEAVLEFYTSDVRGDFMIHVEGFTKEGLPVSLKETIKVE